MEDFSTILWVVIIVGAMIFNTVAKARRGRGKEGDTPPQHGEAWPSIPWDNDGEADPATTRDPETGRVREVVSREPATRGTSAAGKGETWSENGTGAWQTAGQGQQARPADRTGKAGSYAETARFRRFPGRMQAFGGDCPANARNEAGKAPNGKSRSNRRPNPTPSKSRKGTPERKKNEATRGSGRISPTGTGRRAGSR